MFTRLRLVALASLVIFPTLDASAPPRAPRRVDVGPGIHVFITPPYGDVGFDGNSVAVIGSDGVLVFDSNGTPSATAAVLAEIRKLTAQPVKYVVHSHWHWDHWYGAQVYREAFPGVKVIAHEKTAAMMAGPALDFNKPGLETQLPQYVAMLEKRVASARAAAPPNANLPALERALEDARFFLEQKRSVRHQLPTVTFKDRYDVKLGDRDIQILNEGRAVTPGDAFMYLPNEKVLVTGDLLVNPISFALSSYPTEWLRTLEHLDAMDAQVIVPGHGEPLRDEALLHATMGVFRRLLVVGKAARARGLAADEALDLTMPGMHAEMVAITGTDPVRHAAFRVQLADWYLHRVYEELDGPLTDAIAPIPVHQDRSAAQTAVDELLAAERAFAAAAAGRPLIDALPPMFADEVVMPLPSATFARSKAEAAKALAENKDNTTSTIEWWPIRGGVSADGQHGFTVGYGATTRADRAKVPFKYVAYWVKKPEGWRVAVYKRVRAGDGAQPRTMMAAALPPRMVPASNDPVARAKFRASLDQAERAFSDDAQTIGLGPAFAKYGSADAVNVGAPTSPEFVLGAEAIGQNVGRGSEGKPSPVRWAPDDVIVASSGDLGVTFGMIRQNGEPPKDRPGAVPFITIWRRASPADPWRYVAE